MTVSRAANVVLVVLVLGVALILRPPLLAGAADADRTAVRRIAAGVVAIGLLDAAATISFAIGLETSLTWLVGLTSSFGPAVAIVFAVGAMGERLRRASGWGWRCSRPASSCWRYRSAVSLARVGLAFILLVAGVAIAACDVACPPPWRPGP